MDLLVAGGSARPGHHDMNRVLRRPVLRAAKPLTGRIDALEQVFPLEIFSQDRRPVADPDILPAGGLPDQAQRTPPAASSASSWSNVPAKPRSIEPNILR